MTSRYRPLLLVGLLALAGCDDAQYAGPILYRDSERMAKDLAEKPKIRAAVRKALADLYGEDVRHLKVPENSGLRDGGIYLADRVRRVDVDKEKPATVEPVLERDPATRRMLPVEGGYALYRKHCLHCHGVTGAGDGPTATFLYPRPRDYRPGIFKFTSTNPTNAKPTRDDLRKTLLYGLHGTSMPGFEAIMNPSQIEQVIDYMTFLSIRGETERYLIEEVANAEDKDAETALPADLVGEIVQKVTSSWKEAEAQVVNPPVRRVPSGPESVARGRDLFLGTVAGAQTECVKCHGVNGQGNGEAFIEPEVFRDVVFRQWSLDQAVARLYQAGRSKAEADGHAKAAPQADPAGVARFLADNPNLVALLRKERGLLAETPDPVFAAKAKADAIAPDLVAAARKLLPELDDPAFRDFLASKVDLWGKSLDDWQNPLRPANLVEGTYKGGRRPIDLYWRLAKGINGAKMPAHSNILKDDQIWDVVNFVLALPDDPALLRDASPPAHKPAAVAGR